MAVRSVPFRVPPRTAADFEVLGKERLLLAQLARDEARLAVAIRDADADGAGRDATPLAPPPTAALDPDPDPDPDPVAVATPAPAPTPDDDRTVATFLNVIEYLSTDAVLAKDGLFREARSTPAVDSLFERMVAEDSPGPVDLFTILDPAVVTGTFARLVNVGG